MSNLNWRIVFQLLGILLIMVAGLMIPAIGVALIYGENEWAALLISAIITGAIGFILFKLKLKEKERIVRKREGYLVVSLGWVIMSIFGALPYIISQSIPNFTNAFFETISGFTTTGASILNDIESMPHCILFWRSMTQWIGGMGIIVMTIAIFPILGIGGMELFVAEAPGPTSDKIHPRIKETAKRLWFIYSGLTFLLTLLLWIEGMTLFDSVNHALTTMATGGFSTKQASIAAYPNPLIQYTIIVFMFLAGTNYTLMYFGIKRKFKPIANNEEFLTYFRITLVASVVCTVLIYFFSDTEIEKSFRDAAFQVVSLITTTGFVSADYTAWAPFITLIFFGLMFLGGSAGSTSGGIKIIRHLAMAKNCFLEFRRILHRRAIIPVKINKKVVSSDIISNVLVFVLVYISIFVLSSVIMSFLEAGSDHMEFDFDSAIGAVATSLGNVGPGLGSVGPVDNFYHVSWPAKWFLAFLMLLGRLELYTVLVLFTPFFWKDR